MINFHWQQLFDKPFVKATATKRLVLSKIVGEWAGLTNKKGAGTPFRYDQHPLERKKLFEYAQQNQDYANNEQNQTDNANNTTKNKGQNQANSAYDNPVFSVFI